jgi:ABC-type antimicrobial peptide transport system permease subunit
VARWFWPDESGVGQSLPLPRASYHVIVVVEDARFGGLDDTSHGQLYIPAASPGVTFVIRGRSSAEAAMAAVMRAVDAGGSRIGVTRAETFDQAFAELLRRRAGQAWMYGSFAASALVIVVAGVLGLVAMSTAVRTRELGVRAALGASRRRLLRQMLGEQLVSVCVGLAAGAVIASWAVGYVRASLYAFTPYDWRLWSIAGMIILVSGLMGTLIPAVRASRVDPATVLKAE